MVLKHLLDITKQEPIQMQIQLVVQELEKKPDKCSNLPMRDYEYELHYINLFLLKI